MEFAGDKTARVLLIALDAADVRLIEQWIGEGSLPNLAALTRRGAFGRLVSSGGWLSGATWPTFYTGTSPPSHGIYHFLQWHRGRMSYQRPDPSWIPVRPFWRDLATRGHRVLIIDPPTTYTPEPLDGVEIVGYAAHDHLHTPASYPKHVLPDVLREFGVAPVGAEIYSSSGDIKLRDVLVEATERLTEITKSLMRKEDWDLCLTCLTAPHRAGHRLWCSADPDDRDAPSNALKQVYVACDAAVGRLVEAAGAGTTCIVFALHGLQANTSRVDVLDAMLNRVLGRSNGRTRPDPIFKRVLDRVPHALRSRVKSQLPLSLQDRLSARRWTGSIDWANQRAFSLISDLQGYVRLNIKGRERAGIVNSGSERDELVALIADGLCTFVDGETRQPIVDRVTAPRDLFGDGPRLSLLPDLIVHWNETPARHRAIESPEYGTVNWPTPGEHPTGRSGNHRGEGFFVGVGPKFAPGDVIEGATIVDLMPTVYSLLNTEVPSHCTGRALL